jgi:DNA polymerase-3 subunit alpha
MDLAGLGYDWYDSEDYSDPEVYKMLRDGWTSDVFQMAKYSPTKMISDFNVTDIDGLCAVNAGNRPGPLEKDATTGKSMVDLYAEAIKTGVSQKWDSRIDHILDKTMGCIWYQEHCMALGQEMAGYSLGASDIRIRKTLGKKLVKKIPEIRNEFIYGKQSTFDNDGNVTGISTEDSRYCTGCINNGFDEILANKIFDTMAAFAKYSFNRSHSFCYAVLGYKTAWLSLHYPVEFAIANCTINEKEEDIIETLASARKRKISILPPDINRSHIGFSDDNHAIRYGFKAIKGVGATALSFIKEFKKAGQVFMSFDDFYNQIHDNNGPVVSQLLANLRAATGKNSANPIKKDIEMALILSGCFDFSEPNRIKLLNHYLIDIRHEKIGSIIKVLDKEEQIPINEKRFDRKMKLALEKFYMGTYISEHPLDQFPYIDLEQVNDNEQVKIGGIVSNATLKKTKKGNEFLNLRIKTKDDIERTVNVFNEQLAKSLAADIKKNQIVVVQGRYSRQYHNINAVSVKIQIARKQLLNQEDLGIQIPMEEVKEIPQVMESPGYANIWS